MLEIPEKVICVHDNQPRTALLFLFSQDRKITITVTSSLPLLSKMSNKPSVNTTAPVPGGAAALPSPKAPLSNHPAFARDRGSGIPSLRGEAADPTSPTTAGSVSTTSVITTKAGNVTTTVTHDADGTETIEEVIVEEYVESDRPNPYRYDRELFLSLWKDVQPAALSSEELEPVWSVEVLAPLVGSPLSEVEERIIASGSVNSEITTRRMQGGGATAGRRNTGGKQGQMQGQRGGNRDYERGFREFINKVQTTDERPMWAYGQQGAPAAGGFFDAGAYQYGARAPGGVYQDPNEVLWFYRDPQGNIQGPFTGADMHEWYKAGFFTAQLLVKRESDPQFIELGMLVQILSNDEEPFLVPIPIPAAAAPAPEYNYAAAPAPKAAAQPAAPAAATTAAPNTKSRGPQSDLLRNISKELEHAGGEDVKMWSKLGQPGPAPRSLREIQEDAKKKGGK
jgi:hypothetical protein